MVPNRLSYFVLSPPRDGIWADIMGPLMTGLPVETSTVGQQCISVDVNVT